MFDSQPEAKINKSIIYVNPVDYVTSQPIDLQYVVFQGQVITECLNKEVANLYKKNTTAFLKNNPQYTNLNLDSEGCYVKDLIFQKADEGQLVKGKNAFMINNDVLYQFYSFSPKYYTQQEIWLFGINPYLQSKWDIGLLKNATVYTIESHRIADELSINVFGDISSNAENKVRLTLNSTAQLRHLWICTEKSFGIIDIQFNAQNNKKEIIIPSRLKNIDMCYKTSRSLAQNNGFKMQEDFLIKTQELIEGDYFKIYILDEDQYYDGRDWQYSVESPSGENIGAEDFVYKWHALKK